MRHIPYREIVENAISNPTRWVDKITLLMKYHDIAVMGRDRAQSILSRSITILSGTLILKTILSYVIMRRLEPKKRWGLYIVDYRVGTNTKTTILCMNRDRDIVEMTPFLISSIVTQYPMCRVDDIPGYLLPHIDERGMMERAGYDVSILDTPDITLLPPSIWNLKGAWMIYHTRNLIREILSSLPPPECTTSTLTPSTSYTDISIFME